MRADPAIGAMPVVLLTGHSGSDQVEAGLAAGASAYLTKPFALEELLGLLERLNPSAGGT